MPDTLAAGNRNRFGEPSLWLPVLFIVANIIAIWVIYMMFYCIPAMANAAGSSAPFVETIVFNAIAVMVVICYMRCILTHPGTIPSKEVNGDSTWEYEPRGGRPADTVMSAIGLGLQETKRSGDRRHCKWCAKYKPDRCHHCRVCRQCILKMDHHCPWIYNCVGFANHKWFFLLLLYTSIATNIVVWTMLDSVQISLEAKVPFITMFMLIFGETLAAFLGIIVTVFFLFHCWLMMRAMTTIEFCEKSMKRTGYDTSVYNRGCYGNLCAVLGDHPILWLLPLSPPSGDGVNFITEETPMRRMKDLESHRGIRKKAKSNKKRERGGAAGTGEYAGSSGPPSVLNSSSDLSTEKDLLYTAQWSPRV
jgi:hypothetical protein